MPVGTLKPGSTIDILHGVEVADPYRWLEDRNSDQTEEWISEQMRVHDRYFSKLPTLNMLRSRVSEYLNVEILDQPAQVGSYVFFRRRMSDQQQACIYVRDLESGSGRSVETRAACGCQDSSHFRGRTFARLLPQAWR